MAAGFFFVHRTWGGLVLRVVQCAFALASICILFRALDPIPEDAPTADLFLTSVMLLNALWSFFQTLLHLYFLWIEEELQHTGTAWLFTIADALATVSSLAGASSSFYITLLFQRDTGLCGVGGLPCGQFLLAVSFAYTGWALQATTACASYCQLVKLVTQQQHGQ